MAHRLPDPQDRSQRHRRVHRRVLARCPHALTQALTGSHPLAGLLLGCPNRLATAEAPPGSWACSRGLVSAAPRSSLWPWCSPPTRTQLASTPGATSTRPRPATCTFSPTRATPTPPLSTSPAASSPRQPTPGTRWGRNRERTHPRKSSPGPGLWAAVTAKRRGRTRLFAPGARWEPTTAAHRGPGRHPQGRAATGTAS